MKKILLVALTAVAFASCQQKTESTSTATDSTAVVAETKDTDTLHPGGPVLNFETESYNFGKIKKGESVSYDFKFKNTGRIPLIIKEAIAMCGCTVPEPPKEPIQPGASSVIKVVFNSEGKPVGEVKKGITVTSNALNSTVQLLITGEIVEK
jgi:hypothetical protein